MIHGYIVLDPHHSLADINNDNVLFSSLISLFAMKYMSVLSHKFTCLFTTSHCVWKHLLSALLNIQYFLKLEIYFFSWIRQISVFQIPLVCNIITLCYKTHFILMSSSVSSCGRWSMKKSQQRHKEMQLNQLSVTRINFVLIFFSRSINEWLTFYCFILLHVIWFNGTVWIWIFCLGSSFYLENGKLFKVVNRYQFVCHLCYSCTVLQLERVGRWWL